MMSHLAVSQPKWSVSSVQRCATAICLLSFLTVIGVAVGLARLVDGLGATTSLTNAYPWGIWIGFDFALIAFAGAGFTMAGLVHVLHLHRFAPVLRPALMAGLLGYVAVLLLLVLDLGRPDRFYNFLLYWNLHSPLFEISCCVLLYTTVLVIEVSPDFFAWLGWTRLQHWVERLMAPVSIIGVTLSSLHQSTLGTLYLNMPHRLNELWWTPMLPVLFFTSSIAAGLSMAALAYLAACRVRGVTEDGGIMRGLMRIATGVALFYLLLRLGAVAWGGWSLVADAGGQLMALFAAELVIGVIVPALLMWMPGLRQMASPWMAAVLVLLGVGMNRFDSTLAAQTPTIAGSYVPHLFEWLSTAGILAGVALVWILVVQFVLPQESGE